MEMRIIQFVKQIYNDENDVQVKLNGIPNQLKEKIQVKNISFLRVPDVDGDGLCAVEVEGLGGKCRTVHVSFKVFAKRKLFVMKQNGKQGDILRKTDVFIRETYLNGKAAEYPSSIDEIVGRALKRDLSMNAMVTKQMLEDPVTMQRGETVDIVAENGKIIVQTKGKTVDKGKMGDVIRVKNITSGKEIQGRITANNTVTVEF